MPRSSTWLNPYHDRLLEYPEHILPFFGDAMRVEDAEVLQAKLDDHDGLVCELGSGSGNHLVACAEQDPSRLHIGFEIRYKRAYKTGLKADRSSLANVLVLRTSAERLLEFVPAGRVDTLHVNFPEPWNDGRLRRRRLVGSTFLESIRDSLRVGGELRFKTDHEGYFAQVRRLVEGSSRLDLEHWTEDLDQSPFAKGNIETEFEIMFRRYDAPIRFLIARAIGPAGEECGDRVQRLSP
ncbi:MAG: hypothetical protein RL885_03990 [Planctomycetota bacterium]